MPKMSTSQPSTTIECIECGTFFKRNPRYHHDKGLCSAKCKLKRKRYRQKRWKKTPMGLLSERRWRLNPEKKKIDKMYRSTESAKKKAVKRVSRYYHNNKESKLIERSRIYRLRWRFKESKSPELQHWRDWWNKNVSQGCANCGKKEPTVKLTLDHIKPRIDGGEDKFTNFQILCRECNGKKGYGRKKTSNIWKQ